MKKTRSLLRASLVVLICCNLISVQASQTIGGDVSGGGDPCEAKIQFIRDHIESWILDGKYLDMNLAQFNVHPDQYREGMLFSFKESNIKCSSEKIFVGQREKTCRNFIDDSQNRWIECNFDKFLNKTNELGQYRIIHHEYADLAGLEPNEGEKSFYYLSNQIFLKTQVVKKIVAIPYPVISSYPAVIIEKNEFDRVTFSRCFNENACTRIGRPSGYDIEDFNFAPTKRKFKAFGLGLLEVFTGVAFVVWAWVIGSFITVGMSVTSTIAGISATGAIGAVSLSGTVFDAMNPFLQYKMAKVEESIQVEELDEIKFVALEFENEEDMSKTVKVLNKVLKNLSN